MLAKFPEGHHRNRTELGLQTSLGAALIAARGFAAPETGQAYARARELSRQQGDGPQQMPALFGRWIYHIARAELDQALAEAAEMLRLAQAQDDTGLMLIAWRALANTEFFTGDLGAARSHAEQALASYDPRRHGGLASLYSADPGVLCGYFLAHSLLRLGYPEQGRAKAQQALGRARELAHGVTLAHALHHDCLFHQLNRDSLAMREQSAALITFASEHDLPFWQALGRIFHGWALAESGRLEAGSALAAGRACRLPGDQRPALSALCAGAARRPPAPGRRARGGPRRARGGEDRDRRDRGSRLRAPGASDRGSAAADRPGARCGRRRALLSRGDDRRARPGRTACPSCAQRSSSRRCGAIRAAAAKPTICVAPLYTWFSEGLASADLREAAALLDQLA